jgi:hypothetical protein
LSPPRVEFPPLPGPSQPALTPETVPSSDSPPPTFLGTPTTAPLTTRTPRQGATPDGSTFRGLSCIARNRPPDRVAVSPSGSAGVPAAATGRLTPGTAGSASDDESPILRNRLLGTVGAGEEPDFNYPEVHSDPAQRYHDRFGIDEEHDPFLFPWLMNLIFEDRWLLAERDPAEAVRNQYRHRMKINIRDPDPDTANFPNGAYTLPKGRLYIENSPLGLYGPSRNGSQSRIYQWEFLLRYGLTDNLEFRIFSNGFTAQAAQGRQPATTGFSPLAFNFKANFWEENTKYHIPAMGVELYIQTTFGSPAFNSGTQPSLNLLFDQSLPFGIGFEYNVGITGVQNDAGRIAYQFDFQWSFQRAVVKDFDVFFHGFYNEAALPRLVQFRSAPGASIPTVTAMGLGAIWTVNDRLAVFGSYNLGVTPASPRIIALMGFARAF